MECNVGRTDRAARIVFGLVVLAGTYFTGLLAEPIGIILALIGLVMIGTGAVGFCALYKMLGISTCEAGPAETGQEVSVKKE